MTEVLFNVVYNGKIIEVSDDEVALVEIIPDGFGGWRERESSIALSE